MAEHKFSQEVSELLQQRIPEARKQLRDSHKNLNDLATYCERNYIETGQSTQALEDTKKYAAQSLASVAYQVNMLATGMLELLDKQMQHLGEMEANISHISQVCVLYTQTTECVCWTRFLCTVLYIVLCSRLIVSAVMLATMYIHVAFPQIQCVCTCMSFFRPKC